MEGKGKGREETGEESQNRIRIQFDRCRTTTPTLKLDRNTCRCLLKYDIEEGGVRAEILDLFMNIDLIILSTGGVEG